MLPWIHRISTQEFMICIRKEMRGQRETVKQKNAPQPIQLSFSDKHIITVTEEPLGGTAV